MKPTRLIFAGSWQPASRSVENPLPRAETLYKNVFVTEAIKQNC